VEDSLRPVLIGLAGGLVMSLLAAQEVSRVLARMPVRINASDPIPSAAVAVILVSVAIGAMVTPAPRAAASDPARALRDE
jgi:ABC-type antimicrobial peptide transport system permease subunit